MFDLVLPETLTPLGVPLPEHHSRHVISNGVKGTAQTIEIMQKMVASYKRNDTIRELVGRILNPKDGSRPCQSKDYYCYAKKLYEWVRDNILYAYDPANVEYIESPERVLKNGIGDCDSQDMLLASMFEQVGLNAQFVTIMADPTRTDEFTHVYLRVQIPKLGWVVADPIMPQKWFGWEPPFPNGRRYWPASTDASNQVIDTSDSISMPERDSQPQLPNPLGISGMRGMGSLGRGHGGRGRRGWSAGGWGGWYGPGYGFDDPIYVPYPVPVMTTDDYVLVPISDVAPQSAQEESPLAEESIPQAGLNGIVDEIKGFILGFSGTMGPAALGLSSTAIASLNTVQSWLQGSQRDQIIALSNSFDRARANVAKDPSSRAVVIEQGKALNEAVCKYQNVLSTFKSAVSGLQWGAQFASLGIVKTIPIVDQIPWPELPNSISCAKTGKSLNGLGVAPAVVISVSAAAAIIALAVTYGAATVIDSLNGVIRTAQGKDSKPHGVIDSAAGLFKSGGSAVFKIGIVAGSAFILGKLIQYMSERKS